MESRLITRLLTMTILLSLAGCPGESEGPPLPASDGQPMVLDGVVHNPTPDMGPPPPPTPKQDGAPPPPPPPPTPDSGLPPPPPDPCKTNESFFNGHCYLAVGYKWMDYQAASQLCAANQGKVASILSVAENQFIFGLLPPLNSAAWIGLRRKTAAFTWVDGHPKGYVNWAPGEPNNEGGGEECAVMWGPNLSKSTWHGKWNDASCTKPGRDTVICKRKP